MAIVSRKTFETVWPMLLMSLAAAPADAREIFDRTDPAFAGATLVDLQSLVPLGVEEYEPCP